ncbi:MAG TPA: TIGR03087 family PEP-CTERM/XrtA system glycosyltransferase [Gemmataceae bacterium]|jgi:sugar transferase (PEP-CTERM/EpsH1 system associated)
MSNRVLYLTHRVPFPPDKGDRIRNYHVLRQLARRHCVWLACLADEPIANETSVELNRLCERVTVVPVSPGRWLRAGTSLLRGHSISEGAFAERGLRQAIRAWTQETHFAAALVSASSLAPYLRMPELAAVPKLVDLVDVDSQKWSDFADYARGPKRWLYRLESRRVRKLERDFPKWTRAVAVVSQAEADVFDAFAGTGAATVAANGVDLDYFSISRESKTSAHPSCVFVGAMDYWPNVDGAVWFAREVWPRLRVQLPDAEFRIVGRKPTPEVQRLTEIPGVQVIGSTPDVRSFVAEASVVVVPLRLARGIQNKVLEAMAMGKAVVAAPPALAALKTEPGTHLLEAESPEEWIEALTGLFTNPQRRRELGLAARQYVKRHHHWETCLEPLLAKIE